MSKKEELMSSLKDGINIVDFWAEWCGPCRVVGPVLDSLNESNEDVNVIKVNVDENRDLATEYGIRSIPTIFFMDKEGEKLNTIVGAKDKSHFESIINDIRKTA